MYKRLELHNHSTESDANITIEELADHMYQDQVDAFAITDHNTISGHPKLKKLLEEKKLPMQGIYGMEYTTYYGHILCLNLKEYVPWENINFHKPELLFAAVREKGALAGVAHPFSFGHPFSRGCRFDMTITDFSAVDFIEIFNDLEPLHEVNERGLLWWEDLVLQGYPLAFTCGMDLHGKWDMSNQYATFIQGEEGGCIEQELETAIKTQKTYISRGPILEIEADANAEQLICRITATQKPGYQEKPGAPYFLTLKTKKGTSSYPFMEKEPLVIPYSALDNEKIIIPKLYQETTEIENLICVSPVLTQLYK